MNRQERILSQLSQLRPTLLKVDNDSSKHRSHTQHLGDAGYTGETHYRIEISSPDFQGLSRIDIHRKINDLLRAEFEGGLHALEIKIAKIPAVDP